MWKDLDMEQLAEEENRYSLPRSSEEIEQLVVTALFEMHNSHRPCGPVALHRRLNDFYHLKPLPSARMIGRILARNGLTQIGGE